MNVQSRGKELFVNFACRYRIFDVILVNFQPFFLCRAWIGRNGPSISSGRSRDAVRRREAGESGAPAAALNAAIRRIHDGLVLDTLLGEAVASARVLTGCCLSV